MGLTKKEILALIGIFAVWCLVLAISSMVAPNFLEYQPSFPYSAELLATSQLPQWLYSWANFDGVHYLTIIEKGYVGTANIQAFFPLYPLTVAVLTRLLLNPIATGLIISGSLSTLLIVLLYSLVKQQFDNKLARITLLVFLSFPTSFFFAAMYSESLFMVLVIGTFLAAYKRKWLAAGLLTALASATRVVGVMLVPALLIELALQTNPQLKLFNLTQLKLTLLKLIVSKKKKLVFISLGFLGLLTYMLFLTYEFGDPLYFFHVQSEFAGTRQESLVIYPQVWWRSLKILLTYRPLDLKYFAYIQEFIVGSLGLAGLLYAFKKVRASYVVFALLAFLVPTLTGTFSSMPRYMLVCFPIFILLAQVLKNKKLALWLYLLVSTTLLIFNTILFIQGYWVA